MLCFEIRVKFAVPDSCPMTEKNNGDNPSNSYTLGIITTERERLTDGDFRGFFDKSGEISFFPRPT